METTMHKAARGTAAGPRIHLLWRHPTLAALLRAVPAAHEEAAVVVRLVNQSVDDEAVAAAGLRLVTLPMAFAGLNEHDPVLRDAVLHRLREHEAAPVVPA